MKGTPFGVAASISRRTGETGLTAAVLKLSATAEPTTVALRVTDKSPFASTLATSSFRASGVGTGVETGVPQLVKIRVLIKVRTKRILC